MEMAHRLALEGRCQRLKQESTQLYDALEAADMEMQRLLEEAASVRDQNNSLQKENAQLKELLKEADDLKILVEQNKEAACTAEQQKVAMERRCQQMEESAEQLSHQISDCGHENKSLRDEVTRLRQLITELETNLHSKALELKETEETSLKKDSAMEEMTLTVNEYSTIIEVLKGRIRALQSQQELTSQEIALKSMEQTMALSSDPAAGGTLMYEMVQANLEKQLLLGHWKKEQQKRSSIIRSLCNMLLRLLWCYCKVFFFSGFLLLFFCHLMQFIQAQNPDFLRWVIRRVCSTQTMDIIQDLLLKLFLPSLTTYCGPCIVPV
ncbi:inositol 1,4,5-triphosphate receptor associated 2-like isoform X2 [Pseudophryne corroboree]|uniref:inositol 1,4,5-triphosphate receptor associated 2-like isoform X2 n=1 Tax=Pseudophryne corroboree TaxID=495146 RepID=UPI00308181A9